jgi:HK97 family phage portal protein
MSLRTFFSRWFRRKAVVENVGRYGGGPAVDALRRGRKPTAGELLAELKGAAWTCASINASVCAAHPPRLFVRTAAGQARPRCLVRSLEPALMRRFANDRLGMDGTIEEVVEHPLLTLLAQVNPVHNAFDLWELTEMHLETVGSAYWLLDFDPLLGIPNAIWLLPAQSTTPIRNPERANVVEAYETRGMTTQRFPADRVIHFRFPDPRDPYGPGLSPLRACFEQVALLSEYSAMKRSIYDNAALPNVVVTPEESIGPEERDRLEKQWYQKFSHGGQGKALFADASLKVTLLSQSMGDLAALADMRASKEEIANAFHVPMPFLSGDTNLANMQAADHLHKTLAILPRLRRRDEKLNEQLVPKFDPTGRLFFATPDPVPSNQTFALQQEQADLKLGVRTINEVRTSRGLPPVPWGDTPPS